MKRSADNRRSPAEIKYDLQRHYGGLEHSNADMTDFRRPAYSVRHPEAEYGNIQNVSTEQHNEAGYPEYEYGTHKPSAAALIRAQGEQLRETPAEYVARICGRSDVDGQEHTE